MATNLIDIDDGSVIVTRYYSCGRMVQITAGEGYCTMCWENFQELVKQIRESEEFQEEFEG